MKIPWLSPLNWSSNETQAGCCQTAFEESLVNLVRGMDERGAGTCGFEAARK